MISNKTIKAMIHEILEKFAKTGIGQLDDSLEKLFNQPMVTERVDYLGAAPYERTLDRKDYSNEFKNKTPLTARSQNSPSQRRRLLSFLCITSIIFAGRRQLSLPAASR